MQFYPGDWLKDPAVRSVSLAARGLWTDMLCLMHESPRRGYLQHANGKPVTAEQLARMTGCSTDEVSRLLQELEDAGVFSCTDHGVIYSRRMVRDEKIREIRSRSGRLGAQSRLLKQNASKPSANGQANGKQKAGSSFSSSFSSSDGESISSVESSLGEEPTSLGKKKNYQEPPLKSPPQKRGGETLDWSRVVFPDGCDTPDVRAAILEWLEYRRKIGKRYRDPEKQISLLLREHGPAIVEAVRHSIAQGYQGCFLPQKGGHDARERTNWAAGPGQRHPDDAKNRGW